MTTLRRQRGWVGLIVLLIALLIVGVLAQKLMRQMGLVLDTTRTAGPRGAGPTSAAPVDPTGATPVPRNAIERAKGLESSLQQQTQDMGQRIDAQTK